MNMRVEAKGSVDDVIAFLEAQAERCAPGNMQERPSDYRLAVSTIRTLREEREEAETVLDGLFRGEAHLDGCLYKENSRLPCQCGAFQRYSDLKNRVFAILRARDART